MSTAGNREQIRSDRNSDEAQASQVGNRDSARDQSRKADNNQTATESVADKVVRAAHAEDEPMGRETPEAPFALVGLSYLTALALVVLVVAWIVFLIVS